MHPDPSVGGFLCHPNLHLVVWTMHGAPGAAVMSSPGSQQARRRSLHPSIGGWKCVVTERTVVAELSWVSRTTLPLRLCFVLIAVLGADPTTWHAAQSLYGGDQWQEVEEEVYSRPVPCRVPN